VTPDAWASLIFYVVAILAVVGGLKLVTEPDMIRGALSLVLSLASVAVVYLLLSADFLAMVQILVYVGAIMILMLFAIMLTPGQVELPVVAERGQQLGAALVAIVIGGISIWSITDFHWSQRANPLDSVTTETIGRLLLTGYVLPFEIASLLLTAGMIGAIVIARED
jgi:NADH:ubiquinone oxidoreductase subunit 6 (subunit J)